MTRQLTNREGRRKMRHSVDTAGGYRQQENITDKKTCDIHNFFLSYFISKAEPVIIRQM